MSSEHLANIGVIRAYIESEEPDDDNYAITIEVKDKGISKPILAGKVEMAPRPWIYLDYNEDNDLIINNSEGMESNKWNHIIYETLGQIQDDEQR